MYTPYQNYMWNGMTGLFLKIEQNNLCNEINFNLPTTDPDQRHRDPPDDRRVRLPLEPPPDRPCSNAAPVTAISHARAVRLPRQHGGRHGDPRPAPMQLPPARPDRIPFA